MKGKLVAVAAATMTLAYAPAANADSRKAELPTASLDGTKDLPQTIQLPAVARGKGGPTEGTLDFEITGFTRGKHGTLCAVGNLSGTIGATVLDKRPVSVPAAPNGGRANPSDCERDGDDDHEGGLGLLQRPGLGGTPSGAMALGVVQPAPFYGDVGGAIVPTQICTILDLILNPIHLNLLGLVVDTSRIRVTITGNPALGLLGNLLCALLGP